MNQEWAGRIALLLCVTFSVLLCAAPISDFDTFWHLANGRAMVDSGRIVSTELFSYSAAGTPFDNHAWLAQIAMYLAWSLAGANGVIALKLVIVAAVAGITFQTLRNDGIAPAAAAIGVVSMIAAGVYHYTDRPNLFSLLLLALALHLLERLRNENSGTRALWMLPALFFAWDVLHGSVYGLLLVGAYVTGAVLSEFWSSRLRRQPVFAIKRVRSLLLVAAGVALVVAINPWGPLGSEFFAHLLTQDSMNADIGEYQRTPVIPAFTLFWIIWGISIPVAVIAVWKKDLASALLLVSFGYLAWRYSRAVAPFCVVALPLIARHAREIFFAHGARRYGIAAAWVLLLCMLPAIVVYKVVLPRHVNSFGFGVNPEFFPAATLKFLDAHAIGGNQFNSGELGGYIAFSAPGRKIFLYNHHTVFADVLNTLRLPGGTHRWNFNYALLGYNWERYRHLFPLEQWAPVYWEQATMLLLRRTPENQPLIAAREIGYFSPRYSGEQIRALARDPRVAAPLLRETAAYLQFRADAEIAGVFADLIAPLDRPARDELLRQALTGNPDHARLRALQ